MKKAGAKVVRFVRFEVGEGIEKETTDFAAEVAARSGFKGLINPESQQKGGLFPPFYY